MFGTNFGIVQAPSSGNSIDWTTWTGDNDGPIAASPLGVLSKSQVIPISGTQAVQIATQGTQLKAVVLTYNQIFFVGVGTVASGETGLGSLASAVALDPTHIFIIYTVSTNLRGVVITVNTTTNAITFGTPVTIVTTSDTTPTICALTSEKVLIGYDRNGVVVTIQPGTNVIDIIGTPATIITPSATVYSKSLQYISTDKAIVTALYDNGGSPDSGAAVITVTGTTINAVSFSQFGTIGTFSSTNNVNQTIGFSTSTILYVSALAGGSGFGAHILTVSGTSFSAGTLQTFLTDWTVGNISNCSLCALNSTQAMLIYSLDPTNTPAPIVASVITLSLTATDPVPLYVPGSTSGRLNTTFLIDAKRVIFSSPDFPDSSAAGYQILQY